MGKRKKRKAKRNWSVKKNTVQLGKTEDMADLIWALPFRGTKIRILTRAGMKEEFIEIIQPLPKNSTFLI